MAYFETSDLLTTQAVKCPFCGGNELQLLDLQTTFWVTCKTCSANGPSGNSPEQALEYWDRTGVVTEL